LIGSAGANSQDYPYPEFLFSSSSQVDNILTSTQITEHVYNGVRVPVANPHIDYLKNYSSSYENSQYMYLTYQALEDKKWNIYLKQIRLSEYSREMQMQNSVSSGNIVSIANSTSDPNAPGLGLTEVIYRVVCVSDKCTDIGNGDYLLLRTVVMDVILSDGREVINPSYTSGNWGSLCDGTIAENYPKNKVFVKLTQSAIGDRCPDQFQFNEIFQNWETGQEYTVPLFVNSASQLFNYLSIPGDQGIALGQFDPHITQGETLLKSSSAGSVWYDVFDEDANNWSVVGTAETINSFKGLDISPSIRLSVNETGHATNPKVCTDYSNNLFVIYEHTDSGIQNIRMIGTAEPEDKLPAGSITVLNPDTADRYFFNKEDFTYSIDVTSDGVNQLPDIHIDLNDVIHIVWQSNRDKVWEIYYANSTNDYHAM